MKNIKVVFIIWPLILIISFQAVALNKVTADSKEEIPLISYSISPSVGLTFGSISNSEQEEANILWISSLLGDFKYAGSFFQFDSDLFLQYGQSHSKGKLPEKLQDNLIFSLMPSITLLKRPEFRLFLKTTVETQINEGIIEGQKTNFFDPAFLYQTLFLGKRNSILSDDGDVFFEVTYGAGYAFQQTVTSNFKIVQSANTTGNADFESGLSLVFESEYKNNIIENVNFNFSLKSIAITKSEFLKDIENSRFSSLLLAGFEYKFIGLSYTNRIIYDRNYSERRQMEQSMVVSIKLNF